MSAEPTTQEPSAAIVPRPPVQIAGNGLRPKDFDDLWRVARIVAGSGLAPRGLERPEQTFVAMASGLELGFSAMQALASIAVVSGRPTLNGMAAKALVLESGKCERWLEEPLRVTPGEKIAEAGPSHLPDGLYGYRCRSKRKGLEDWAEETFTLDDARRAGLWPGKADSNWAKYPARMLKMRALGFVARDLYPDVLKGLYIAEEMEEPEPAPKPSNVERLKDRLTEATAFDETGPIDDPRFVETTTVDVIDATPLDTPEPTPASDAKQARFEASIHKLIGEGAAAFKVKDPLGDSTAEMIRRVSNILGAHGCERLAEVTSRDEQLAVYREVLAVVESLQAEVKAITEAGL